MARHDPVAAVAAVEGAEHLPRALAMPVGLRGLEVGGTTIRLTPSGIFTIAAVATVMVLLLPRFWIR